MERFDIKSSDIHTLLQNCLEENNYKNFNVNITGTTGVGEGYTGLVIFAEASGIHNGEKITLKFVIKHSTTKKEYRKEVPINTLYKLEALVYESLFPKYQQLINQTGATALNLPKWYKSVFGEDSEIMIFEDLKQKGYEMHDRKVRFNLDHIKVVLEKYAKLHALSFAMRDQRPKEFNEIVTTIDGLNRGKKSATIGFFQEFSKILPQTLELNNENELLNRVKQIEICDLYDIIDNSDNQSVILHIDCWNNNFLFKYPARQSKAKPDGVIIIDWQLASVGSPISDVSLAIFNSITWENYNKIEELLEHYYSTFSEYLTSLGSDSQQLFSKERFYKAWKENAKVCLLLTPFVIALSERDDADIPDIAENHSLKEVFKCKNSKKSDERIIKFTQYMKEKSLI